MPERKDYLFHEHRGRAHPFRQGADESVLGVWYTRWICSNCSVQVLLIKPESKQKTVFRDGDTVSAYGFTVDEIVRDRKTGRRAQIASFDQVYVWRHFDGRNQRVPSDEWDVTYRWIEPDPAKPEGAIRSGGIMVDREKFLKRFEKIDT